jgi:hypothetical protein
MDEQREGPVPGLQVPAQHGPCDRFGIVGLSPLVVGRQQAGPDAAEDLAGVDLFDHASDLGPGDKIDGRAGRHGGLLGDAGALNREVFDGVAPAIESAARGGPISLEPCRVDPMRGGQQRWSVGRDECRQFNQVAYVHRGG